MIGCSMSADSPSNNVVSSPLDSSALPLSRHEFDRDYLSRSNPQLFEELRHDPTLMILVLWKGKALLKAAGGGLALLSNDAVVASTLSLYLGRSLEPSTLNHPVIALIVDDESAAALAPDDSNWGDLRQLGSTLNDLDAGLFTTAVALANWHDSHRFSPRTGEPTHSAQGGWVRKDADDREVFPRTDAAIIVGITDADDRILLGHNAMWPANRYSLLAGFVEPGESLESAVLREVFEESGIRVIDPVYLGSQPWPFPASLMLGFTARVDPSVESTLTPDGNEILDLRWFSRDELTASLAEIGLPGPTSIARAILDRWYGSVIPDSREW